MRFMGSHVAPFGPGDLVLVGPHLPHAWLSAHYHEALPLAQAAALVRMTPTAFSRFFRRGPGRLMDA